MKNQKMEIPAEVARSRDTLNVYARYKLYKVIFMIWDNDGTRYEKVLVKLRSEYDRRVISREITLEEAFRMNTRKTLDYLRITKSPIPVWEEAWNNVFDEDPPVLFGN